MIVKSSEINKINKKTHQLMLFYGKNEGLKNEVLGFIFKDNKNIYNYHESEILDNESNFLEDVLTNSFFEQHKSVVIKRATDKILRLVETLHLKNLGKTTIILNANSLEKKSKLRTFFEKNKKLICVPFYPDNNQMLYKLAHNFLNKKKISISPLNINLIINKISGDREFLVNELQKIEYYCKNGKKITDKNILKLINLYENYSVSELIDNYLAKNKKKTIQILSENNYNNEESIIIIRTFIAKVKKLMILTKNFENNKNIDLTISSAKPPIFWKEKEITKQQIQEWKPKNLKKLIYKLNQIELQIKKNINISINLITDFILDQSYSVFSN